MTASARKPLGTRRRKRRSELWIVAGVLVVLAGALAYAARDVWTRPAMVRATDGAAGSMTETVVLARPQAKPTPELDQTEEARPDLIDDDGETLWASPTHGPPLDFNFLPAETELILALRPAALLANPEGTKVLAALGPFGTRAVEEVARTTGLSLAEIEQLVVGWRMVSGFGWAYTQLVHVCSDADQIGLRARLEEHVSNTYVDRTFIFVGDRVYFDWSESDQPKLVEGTRELFAELFPREPVLPRALEQLVRYTDSRRQVTLIVRPQFLLGDQHDVFSGRMAPLRQPLEDILEHDVAACSLSMNWDADFFIELVAVPTLDSSPEKMSDELATRVNELPERVEEFVLGLEASPHSRRVAARLPEMVRRLAAYTRHGFDRDAAVLRCYLPVTAGHNLIMGVELALAEEDATAGKHAGVLPVAATTSPASIAERLQKKTSLRFAREELEAALNMLAQDVGVTIVIRGPDLQLDGITRNQLFAIDMADRSGEEILVEILRRANPDKLAAGPADPRQKLVYVVGPKAISITTRAKAAERGEELPAVFQQ